MLGPILTKSVDPAKAKLVKVNVDESEELAKKYQVLAPLERKIVYGLQVSALPTVIAFKDGQKVDSFVGLKDAKFVKNFVDELVQK
jgi:thioredoxin 1